jgi:hypothetical protein
METPRCPECAQGKHKNCIGWTLDSKDEQVGCYCPLDHDETPLTVGLLIELLQTLPADLPVWTTSNGYGYPDAQLTAEKVALAEQSTLVYIEAW